MNARSAYAIGLSTLAYLAVTFPVAYFWHLVWFQEPYEAIGAIGRKDPIFAFGVAAMLVQGVLLSFGYRYLLRGEYGLRSGLVYCLMVGVFFWSSHVLAFAAKSPILELPSFFALETAFLVVQFGCIGLLLGPIHRRIR